MKKMIFTNNLIIAIGILTLTLTSSNGLFSQAENGMNQLSCPYCDLTGKDFSNQDLTNANLAGAILENANFSGATLNGTQLVGANLKNAIFDNSTIGSSDLTRTNFSSADLSNATFVSSKIGEANFQFTDITCTVFSGSDLREAQFGPNFKYTISENCKPSFRNCLLSCEFSNDWSFFELKGTKRPNCKQYNPKKFRRIPLADGLVPPPKDSVWVAKDGADNENCGTKDNPCQTIAKGIDRCAGNCGVMIEAASFQLKEPLYIEKDSISLIGGFHKGEPTGYQTAIIGPDSTGAVVYCSGARNIYFSQLIIKSTPPSIYKFSDLSEIEVLKLQYAQNVNLHNTTLVAGPAKSGYKGRDATPGGDGIDGGQGFIANGNIIQGGLGALWPCCWNWNIQMRSPDGNSGLYPGQEPPVSNGPDSSCPTAGGTPAQQSEGSYSAWWQAGYDSTVGSVGNTGSSSGTAGNAALYCSSGGGAGSPGCDAGYAEGGSPGDASFAIVMELSTINVLGNQVIFIGGKGGDGGQGGKGASGGKGGKGGGPSPSVCQPGQGANKKGTPGGDGGSGAASSGAPGGNGGPSACLAIVKRSEVSGTPIQYIGLGGSPGLPGKGGGKGNGACAAPDGTPAYPGIAKIKMIFDE